MRAGALVRFFDPISPRPDGASISTPDVLYAASVGAASKSQRSVQTLSGLARTLQRQNVPSINEYLKDAYDDMAADVLRRHGVVLIAWEHSLLPAIVRVLTGKSIRPGTWPGDRFDMVWILDKNDGGWNFKSEWQRLLPDDQG